MSDRREFWIPTELDVDSIKDSGKRKRVSGLIVELNEGKLTLATLWQRYSASIKDDKILNDDYWDIPLAVAEIFGIPSAEDINDSIEKILNKIDKLEAKFRNHRHETTKNFCGKAEY